MATLTAIRGDTLQRTWIWTDDDGDVIDLTDYEVTFVVRFRGTETAYTTADAVTVTPAAGRIDVEIDEADTVDWPGPGTFKLVVVSPDADPVTTTIKRGNIRVE